MRIEQFKQLLTIVEEQSMTKAATKLNISQPALSLSMKKLESDLGFEIFNKVGRTLNLTHQGEEVFLSAKRIVNEIDVMENICKSHQQGQHTLNISNSFSILAKDTLTDIFKKYQKDRITCRFEDCSITKSIENVYSGISEIGIIRYPAYKQNYLNKIFESKNIECTVMVYEPACVVAGIGNPLYHIDADVINYRHIQSFPFITYFNEVQDNIWMSFLKDLNIDYSRISLANVGQVVETVKNTSLLFIDTRKDHTHSDWYDHNHIRYIELEPTVRCALAYIKLKNRQLSDIGQDYIDRIVERIDVWQKK